MNNSRKAGPLAALAATATSLTGCVVAPVTPRVGYYDAGYAPVVAAPAYPYGVVSFGAPVYYGGIYYDVWVFRDGHRERHPYEPRYHGGHAANERGAPYVAPRQQAPGVQRNNGAAVAAPQPHQAAPQPHAPARKAPPPPKSAAKPK